MNVLREYYENEIVDAMMKKFSYKNKMEVPKIEKIVINMGLGEAKENAKANVPERMIILKTLNLTSTRI